MNRPEMAEQIAKHVPVLAQRDKEDWLKAERLRREFVADYSIARIELERERLQKARRPELAERIKHVSQETDSAGYDILSFEVNGEERPIEVKATMSRNLDGGFYISSNEVAKAAELPNYHIYIVFSALSNQPRILPVREPLLEGGDFQLRPLLFHVTLT